jgi:hypothetical protein
VWGATLLVTTAYASAQAVTQPALKAAFLFNFAKFVEWPADVPSAGPLTVCVLNDLAVEDSLDQLINGVPVTGRRVAILRGVRQRSLRACNVLYVGSPEPWRTAALDDVKGAPTLTVGDGDDFARGGGMIGLFVDDGRMRFAVNPDAVQRAGLRLSSRLLSLATIVKEGRHGQR